MRWNLSVSCAFFSSRIRARDRLSRDETLQKPPDQSPDRQQPNRRHSHGSAAQYATQHSEHTQHRTVHQPQPSPGHHHVHTSEHQNSTAMVAPPTAKGPPPEVQPRRRVSADQMYATHREARLESRQALKEEAHTEGLLKSRKAVLPSEIRKREKSLDDPHREQHEETDFQDLSPEQRRRSHGEEDWDREQPRERGRERTVQRIRAREHLCSHDNQDERVFRATQPVYHQGPKTKQHEPLVQQAYEVRRTEHAAHVQQEPPRQHPPQHLSLQQENQRPPQERHEYDWRTKKTPGKQQDSQIKHQDPQNDQQQQHALSHQRFDSVAYLQRGSSLPQAKHRSLEVSGGPKPKIRTRSMSDIGLSQHTAVYHAERQGASREAPRTVPPPGVANGDTGTLDTRVSVARLRHSYLENANRKPEL